MKWLCPSHVEGCLTTKNVGSNKKVVDIDVNENTPRHAGFVHVGDLSPDKCMYRKMSTHKLFVQVWL